MTNDQTQPEASEVVDEGRAWKHRFELEGGGYVEIRPNGAGSGVMLQVGWQDEGMAEVALTEQETTRIGPALILTKNFVVQGRGEVRLVAISADETRDLGAAALFLEMRQGNPDVVHALRSIARAFNNGMDERSHAYPFCVEPRPATNRRHETQPRSGGR